MNRRSFVTKGDLFGYGRSDDSTAALDLHERIVAHLQPQSDEDQ